MAAAEVVQETINHKLTNVHDAGGATQPHEFDPAVEKMVQMKKCLKCTWWQKSAKGPRCTLPHSVHAHALTCLCVSDCVFYDTHTRLWGWRYLYSRDAIQKQEISRQVCQSITKVPCVLIVTLTPARLQKGFWEIHWHCFRNQCRRGARSSRGKWWCHCDIILPF